MKIKRTICYTLIITLAVVTYFPAQAQQKHDDNEVIYHLDIEKSKLLWQAPKNRHNGFILFNSGTLSNFTAGRPTQGIFSINMNSMSSTDKDSDAGRKEVDDNLRSEDFFAVSKYPTAIMLVKQIRPEQNPDTYKVSGDLTIRGVTKTIEFAIIMKQNNTTITATANTSISREKWNINHKPQPASWDFLARIKDNFVDDDIPVSLILVFTKK